MTQEEIEQLNARIAQMRMSTGDSPITMGGQIANTPLNIDLISPMSDPYADPRAKSFDGQERAVDAQRAYANSIRGKGTPQGKMVGEGKWSTYQQPNWGENLEGVVNKLAGGYMAGQADRADEAIDVERGLVKAAELKSTDDIREAELEVDAQEKIQFQKNFEKELTVKRNEAKARALRDTARIAEAKARRTESLRQYNERLEIDEKRAGSANEKITRAGVLDYGKELIKSGIPKANSNMGYLKDLLGDYAEQDDSGKWVLKEGVTEIPGIGGFSNAPAYVGDAITWAADLTRDTSEIDGIGKAIRQGAQKVYNTEIKDLSGSAVSAHEMLRNLKAQGVDIWSSPENFLLGVNAISDGYVSEQNSIDAMTDPEYVAIYKERFNPSFQEVTEKTVVRTGIDKATNERVTEWSDKSVTREPME